MNSPFPEIPSHQLMTFLAVAEVGSVLAAARRMHLSQPAMTTRIRQLEETIGAPLFIRSVRGMELTGAGTTLRDYGLRVKLLLEEAAQVVGKSREQDREILRLGASTTIGSHVLPALIAESMRWHPLAGVEIRIGNTEQVLAWVRDGELPLGLVEGKAKAQAIRLEPFMTDEIVPVFSPLVKIPTLLAATRKVRNAAALMRLPVLWREEGSGTRKVVEAALRKARISARAYSPTFVLSETEAIKAAVLAGMGIAFLSLCSIQQELASGSLKIIHVENLRVTRMFRWALPGGGCAGAAAAFKRFAQQEVA